MLNFAAIAYIIPDSGNIINTKRGIFHETNFSQANPGLCDFACLFLWFGIFNLFSQ